MATDPQSDHFSTMDNPGPAETAPPGITPRPPGSEDTYLRMAPGAKPVAEYELVQLLGRGGSGEVWKALGPGGFHVALKFVRLGDQTGSIELRSLDIIKNQRHPHLLGIFGAWQREDMLILAMELGDRTLFDHLRAAEQQGLAGIPRDELLEYMREAAKGIDHLNGLGIEHRDIKPQNLLLVGGGVKVADFGLAKLLEKTVSSNSGMMTPAYAAPEFLKLQTSSQSDQYSFAVSYCQLRSGKLPFAGNPAQLMNGHLSQPPDLEMLPPEERPILAKALAKKPDERWPNCRTFVDALANAGQGATTTTWPKKNPSAIPRVLAAALLLILAAVAVGIWQPWQVTPEKEPVKIDVVAKTPPPPQPVEQPKPKAPEPVVEPLPVPQLSLLPLEPVTLEAGQTKTVVVKIQRQHSPGRLELQIDNLPQFVQSRVQPHPEDAESGNLELTADMEATEASQKLRVVAVVGALRAEESLQITVKPADPKVLAQWRIKKWIGDLTNEKVDLRVAAAKELEKLGEQPLPTLKETLASTQSPEMRLRLQILLANRPPQLKAASADGRRIYTADGNFVFLRLEEDQLASDLRGKITDMILSADERQVFAIVDGQFIWCLKAATLAFDWAHNCTDGKRLMLTADELEVHVITTGAEFSRYAAKDGKRLDGTALPSSGYAERVSPPSAPGKDTEPAPVPPEKKHDAAVPKERPPTLKITAEDGKRVFEAKGKFIYLEFQGKPVVAAPVSDQAVDMALAADGKHLFVLIEGRLLCLETAALKELWSHECPAGHRVTLSDNGQQVGVTTTGGQLLRFRAQTGQRLDEEKK